MSRERLGFWLNATGLGLVLALGLASIVMPGPAGFTLFVISGVLFMPMAVLMARRYAPPQPHPGAEPRKPPTRSERLLNTLFQMLTGLLWIAMGAKLLADGDGGSAGWAIAEVLAGVFSIGVAVREAIDAVRAAAR